MTDKKTASDSAAKAADTAKESADTVANAGAALAGKGADFLGSLVSVEEGKNIEKGEKLLAALAYVGFLCVLPLAIKPKSKFCELHGKQGLIIILFFFILGVIQEIIGLPPVFLGMIGLLHLLIIIMGVFKAGKGDMKGIPVLAEMTKKLEW